MRERKNVRANVAVRFTASQGEHRETALTLNLSLGGLGFSSHHPWSVADPICFSFRDYGEPFDVFGRVIRREGVVYGVQFYPERRAESRLADILHDEIGRAGLDPRVLDACQACEPGEKPAVFVDPERSHRQSKACTRATLGDVGLDGASLRSEVRPAIGSHVVVSLRNALGTGQPVTVTGEVVRNTPDGFAILFADASHRSRRYVDSLRARLAPRDPTPYYNRVRPRPITR